MLRLAVQRDEIGSEPFINFNNKIICFSSHIFGDSLHMRASLHIGASLLLTGGGGVWGFVFGLALLFWVAGGCVGGGPNWLGLVVLPLGLVRLVFSLSRHG